MSLLVVGSIAFDTIETPFGRREDILGGSASYFSVAASFFTDVRLVAPVGEDFRHASVLEQRKVDMRGLASMPGKTFRWSGAYTGDMNEAVTLKTELNVMETFDPRVPQDYLGSAYVFLANIDPAIQLATLNVFKEAKVLACDTMNFWIHGARETLLRVLSSVDVLIINETEARSLAGQRNILLATREIRKMGPGTVVVKRGEYGALAASSRDLFALPGLPLSTVKDPTGAGDSFAGGFMGFLTASGGGAEPSTVRRAMVYGSVMASFAVEAFGLERLLSLNMDDIEQRYRALLDLTRID